MKIAKTSCKEVIITAPPAKAYTLRAILLSSLAEGTSEVINPLLAADQLALIDSLEKLGIKIIRKAEKLVITGCGGKFSPLVDVLNLGESGVGMNLLLTATSLAGKAVTLTGKEGLLKRPVQELVQGLSQLGCKLTYLGEEGYPPVRNSGTGIAGGHVKMSGAKTSQYFSSIAISAPYAEQPVCLECSDEMSEKPYYDISLETMGRFGIKVKHENYKITQIPNKQHYKAVKIIVEGDFSSASYFFTAAAICKNQVTVKGLNSDSIQGDKKILELLEDMGCSVKRSEEAITIKGWDLEAIEADMGDVPDLVPTIAITAAFARGTTVLKNVGHLRFKECNRLEAIATGLKQMGVTAGYDENSFYIAGNPGARGAEINTYNDHRIAMSFAVAGLRCGDMVIADERCVGKSFPDFWEKLKSFY